MFVAFACGRVLLRDDERRRPEVGKMKGGRIGVGMTHEDVKAGETLGETVETVSDAHATKATSAAAGIAAKFRRALRNGTGLHLTNAELHAFARLGALEIATHAENEELTSCREKVRPTSSETTGSTGGVTAERQKSGRSPSTPPTDGRSYIKALGLAT
jgi:hypothetical protein